MKYILTDDAINGIALNKKIKEEELHEFYITHLESFIDELINWISEAKGSDKILMKEDLKELMTWSDEYILSSNKTNYYLGQHSSEFNTTCEELLELTAKL